MKREWLAGGALVLGFGLSTSSVLAQPAPAPVDKQRDCPPGAYCQVEDVGPEVDAPAAPAAPETPSGETVAVVREGDGTTTIELPPPNAGSDPSAPRTFTYVPPRNGRPGQVIVYEDGTSPPHMAPGEEVAPLPPPATTPKRRRRKRQRRWGIMARVTGVLLPHYRDDIDKSGMGGLGVSLRYRPMPALALDFGADFLGGTDSNGLSRRELPVSASVLFYPNPKDFTQLYIFGGLNAALAHVSTDGAAQSNLANDTSDDYSYAGMHIGVGAEMRVLPSLGLSLDVQAYGRTRTDDGDMAYHPEFYNPSTGEASNTSVGGLARAGVNFWW